jgi:tetratricopeptide (TPR) repeat protein
MERDLGERLDGERILGETQGDVGLLLWRTARDVALWAMTPGARRAALFAEGTADARLMTAAELPDKLAAPVDTLHGLLGEPERADPEIVMLCCGEVAAWARRAGLPHTAAAFAQAGAAAAPKSGDAALLVGMCAREAGQLVRADTWLRRAVALARRERNGAAYSYALVELGAVNETRGKLVRAERFYRLAWRASRRRRARGARMRAAHALFRLARCNGDKASAARFALSAQLAFETDAAGTGDGLLLELARFWTDIGEAERARGALRRLVPALLRMEPSGQLAVLALTARVRATLGQHPRSGNASWRAAWVLLGNEELPDAVRCAAAVDLAHAARKGGDLRSFRAARRVALGLAPQAEFPAVAERLAKLWGLS